MVQVSAKILHFFANWNLQHSLHAHILPSANINIVNTMSHPKYDSIPETSHHESSHGSEAEEDPKVSNLELFSDL